MPTDYAKSAHTGSDAQGVSLSEEDVGLLRSITPPDPVEDWKGILKVRPICGFPPCQYRPATVGARATDVGWAAGPGRRGDYLSVLLPGREDIP